MSTGAQRIAEQRRRISSTAYHHLKDRPLLQVARISWLIDCKPQMSSKTRKTWSRSVLTPLIIKKLSRLASKVVMLLLLPFEYVSLSRSCFTPAIAIYLEFSAFPPSTEWAASTRSTSCDWRVLRTVESTALKMAAVYKALSYPFSHWFCISLMTVLNEEWKIRCPVAFYLLDEKFGQCVDIISVPPLSVIDRS